MAYVKTLGENWTLRDEMAGHDRGLFRAFPIEEPMQVRAALKSQGIIAARPAGLDALKDEWVFRRLWRYETTFSWDGQDERCQLVCDRIDGLREIGLNGETLMRCGVGEEAPTRLNLDISCALTEGENTLRVVVSHAQSGMGIGAPVRLRAGNFMTVREHNFSALEDALEARVVLDVHTSGKYQFRYGVQFADETVGSVCFTQSLLPGLREVRHSVPLEKSALYDRVRPEETTFHARLSIERQGVGCQLIIGDCARIEQSPVRVCGLGAPADHRALEGRLALARALGADGVCGPVSPLESLLGAAEESVTDWPRADAPAFAQLEDMQILAGDQPFWPPQDGGVWALTGGVWTLSGWMEKTFGPNAMGDAGRAARISRFWQAESVRRGALRARLEGRPFWVCQLQEGAPSLVSNALVEFSGAARPAYDALQEAWREAAVYAELPEDMRALPGETVRIPIWLLAAGMAREVVRVEASCLAMDGRTIASTGFPAVLGEDARAGELHCALPKSEGAYVVRVRAVRGGEDSVARADFTLCACEGEAPLMPLMRLEGALLREKDGRLVNAGNCAALAVCSAGYRALLPGEEMACADTYECLNGLI